MSYSRFAAASKPPLLAHWALRWLLCVIATIGAATSVGQAAEPELHDVSVAVDEGVYELEARLHLKLEDDARKAIESGLTLRLTYEIVIDRVRRFLVDAEVAALAQRHEVNYHALSQRWLVRNLNTGEQQDFGTLEAALDHVGELRGLPILDTALATPGPVYQGRIRAVVDLSTAPAAFGWLLFWADDWSAESDWTTWTLRP